MASPISAVEWLELSAAIDQTGVFLAGQVAVRLEANHAGNATVRVSRRMQKGDDLRWIRAGLLDGVGHEAERVIRLDHVRIGGFVILRAIARDKLRICWSGSCRRHGHPNSLDYVRTGDRELRRTYVIAAVHRRSNPSLAKLLHEGRPFARIQQQKDCVRPLLFQLLYLAAEIARPRYDACYGRIGDAALLQIADH